MPIMLKVTQVYRRSNACPTGSARNNTREFRKLQTGISPQERPLSHNVAPNPVNSGKANAIGSQLRWKTGASAACRECGARTVDQTNSVPGSCGFSPQYADPEKVPASTCIMTHKNLTLER